MKKPEPVVVSEVCSLCGLDWPTHGDKPTPLTCIDLLKAELAKKPIISPSTWQQYPNAVTSPYVFSPGNTWMTSSTTALSIVPDDEEPPESVGATA